MRFREASLRGIACSAVFCAVQTAMRFQLCRFPGWQDSETIARGVSCVRHAPDPNSLACFVDVFPIE